MKHTNKANVTAARTRRVATNARHAALGMLRPVSGLWPSQPRFCPSGDLETPFYLNVVRPSDRVINRSKPYVPLQRVSPT